MTGSDGHIDFDLLPTHLTGGCFGNTANDTLYALHPHFQFHSADSAIMLKQSDFVCTTIIVTNTPLPTSNCVQIRTKHFVDDETLLPTCKVITTKFSHICEARICVSTTISVWFMYARVHHPFFREIPTLLLHNHHSSVPKKKYAIEIAELCVALVLTTTL